MFISSGPQLTDARYSSIRQTILGTGPGTYCLTFSRYRQIQLFPMLAHPPDLPRGHPHHQRIRRHILVHHRPRADECILADGHATHDGAVRAQGRAFLDQGIAILVLALDQRPGVVHVGEHHAGPTEHALLQGHVVVDGHVVLDLAVVADHDLVADKHVLAQGHAGADACAAADVDEMPDAAALADLGAFVDDSGLVLVIAHFFRKG